MLLYSFVCILLLLLGGAGLVFLLLCIKLCPAKSRASFPQSRRWLSLEPSITSCQLRTTSITYRPIGFLWHSVFGSGIHSFMLLKLKLVGSFKTFNTELKSSLISLLCLHRNCHILELPTLVYTQPSQACSGSYASKVNESNLIYTELKCNSYDKSQFQT